MVWDLQQFVQNLYLYFLTPSNEIHQTLYHQNAILHVYVTPHWQPIASSPAEIGRVISEVGFKRFDFGNIKEIKIGTNREGRLVVSGTVVTAKHNMEYPPRKFIDTLYLHPGPRDGCMGITNQVFRFFVNPRIFLQQQQELDLSLVHLHLLPPDQTPPLQLSTEMGPFPQPQHNFTIWEIYKPPMDVKTIYNPPQQNHVSSNLYYPRGTGSFEASSWSTITSTSQQNHASSSSLNPLAKEYVPQSLAIPDISLPDEIPGTSFDPNEYMRLQQEHPASWRLPQQRPVSWTTVSWSPKKSIYKQNYASSSSNDPPATVQNNEDNSEVIPEGERQLLDDFVNDIVKDPIDIVEAVKLDDLESQLQSVVEKLESKLVANPRPSKE